jgi:hypothetical protein
MRKEGSVQISCTSREGAASSIYKVEFADYATRATTLLREISGETSLREYLTSILKIHADSVRLAIDSINKDEHAEIFHVALSDEQLDSAGSSKSAS